MQIRYEEGRLEEITLWCRVQNLNTLNGMLEFDLTLVEPSGAYSALSSHGQKIQLTREILLQSELPTEIFDLQETLVKITLTRTSEESATITLRSIVTKEDLIQGEFLTTQILKIQSKDSSGGSATVVSGDSFQFELPVNDDILERIKGSEAFHFTVAISPAA